LGDFNETLRLLFFMPYIIMCQVSLKKYQKIKYAIFERPHILGMDLYENTAKKQIKEYRVIYFAISPIAFAQVPKHVP
jgi:pyruvate/2-oxoglutarate dehydrogenase complex dihydrolipoamide dehydrogenase (E3) component